MKFEKQLKELYKTPNRISLAVLVLVHTGLLVSQALIGNNYLLMKYKQFSTYPVITLFEILIPYLVTYAGNYTGRRLK